jgi:hypothetical protein
MTPWALSHSRDLSNGVICLFGSDHSSEVELATHPQSRIVYTAIVIESLGYA